MSYLIIHFDCEGDTCMSLEQLKSVVTNLLRQELVDEESILWDEKNDLYFSVPSHKPFKSYWASIIERSAKSYNWQTKIRA